MTTFQFGDASWRLLRMWYSATSCFRRAGTSRVRTKVLRRWFVGVCNSGNGNEAINRHIRCRLRRRSRSASRVCAAGGWSSPPFTDPKTFNPITVTASGNHVARWTSTLSHHFAGLVIRGCADGEAATGAGGILVGPSRTSARHWNVPFAQRRSCALERTVSRPSCG